MAAVRAEEILVPRGRPRITARVRGWLDRESILGPVFVTPALLLLLLLVAYPFVMAVYFSLSNAFIGRPSRFIGITNFVRLWESDAFRQTFQNAFVFTGIAVFFKVVMGIVLALLLNEQLWFKRMIRGVVLLPWVIPTALSTLGWWWMFNSLYSVVNWTGIATGLMDPPGPNWLGQRYYAMAAVIIVNVWRGLPFFAITILAGLVAIPKELYEAAEADGAGANARFWHITLPLLKPVLAVVVLFSTIFTFSDFNIVYVLTHGGPINSTHLFATLSRVVGIDTGRIGEGAAISLYLFPLLVFVVWAQLRFLVFALFPFYHMTLTSLKQDRELYDRHAVPLVIRQAPTLEHYVKLIWETEFLTWTKNSLLVTALATSASVAIGTVAAYALARLKFFGVSTFGTGIFVTYLVPTTLLFLPLAQVVNWIGLGDSKWALVLTYPTFLVPFCTWLLMGYFRTVPKEVEECAMVDGATRIQALWRIVLPIAVPGLVCAALFAFTLSWNEFIYALTFTSSSEQITASVGITTELIRGDIYFWGELMAGAILGSVPIVILYVFFLDYYVSGLTAGAVK